MADQTDQNNQNNQNNQTFTRFHLSSYRTSDPDLEKTLVDDVISETNRWMDIFKFDQIQRDQTQILSGKVNRTRNEKGEFIVFALIPLRENQRFPAIWDGRSLRESLGEDITLKVDKLDKLVKEKTRVNRTTKRKANQADRNQVTH